MQDQATYALLRRAVKSTCYDLIQDHRIDPVQLGSLVETIANAILERFKAGERNEELLVSYAISRAVESMGYRPN